MNAYQLSRQWFDFAYENPDRATTAQGVLYLWLIEANNRRGFAEKFIFNTQDAGAYTGIRNRKTVWNALHALVENGFVTMVRKAKNQSEFTVISILHNRVASGGALDKSMLNEQYANEQYASENRLSENGTGDHPCEETADGQADGCLSENRTCKETATTLATTLATGHSNKHQTSNIKHQTFLSAPLAGQTDTEFEKAGVSGVGTGLGSRPPNQEPDTETVLGLAEKEEKKKSPPARPAPPFVPPTADDVKQAFIGKTGVNGKISEAFAEKFIAHYTLKGWRYGKARTPLRDWRLAMSSSWDLEEFVLKHRHLETGTLNPQSHAKNSGSDKNVYGYQFDPNPAKDWGTLGKARHTAAGNAPAAGGPNGRNGGAIGGANGGGNP